jgi:hypothetical protein
MKQQKGFVYAYAAGVIDGEGCIRINKHKPWKRRKNYAYSLWVSVGETEGQMVRFLYGNFGGHVYERKPKKPNHRPFLTWTIHSGKAREFLKCIYPFLRTKKKQAEIAIRFQERQEKEKHTTYRKGILGNAPLTKQQIDFREYCYQELKRLKKESLVQQQRLSEENPHDEDRRQSALTGIETVRSIGEIPIR